jgi:hypothetical protein
MSSISWITLLSRTARQRNVDRLCGKPVCGFLPLVLRLLRFDHFLNRGADVVRHLPDYRALLCAERSHAAQNFGERTFFA